MIDFFQECQSRGLNVRLTNDKHFFAANERAALLIILGIHYSLHMCMVLLTLTPICTK